MFTLTLIAFILLIGVLVFVHELGHYLAARAVGIKVEEFAIGMGPKIWGWKRGDTEYNLRLLPIGGFVRMYGEGDYDVVENNSFAGKAPSKRLLVLIAGVTMNIVLAIVILYAQGVHQGFKYRQLDILSGEFKPWFGEKTPTKVAVRDITDDESPLKGKVKQLDIITKINDKEVNFEDFQKTIADNLGKETKFTVIGYASGTEHSFTATPRANPSAGKKPLGLEYTTISFVEFKGVGKVFAGFEQAANIVQNFGFNVNQLIKQSIQNNTITPVADNVGGPLGIFEALKRIITAFGVWGVLEFAALFSINLAVFNILPIPALDGGHVVFTLLELIFRRRLPTKIYNYITLAGFTLIIGFMLLVTSLDFIKHTSLSNVFCNERRHIVLICDLSDLR